MTPEKIRAASELVGKESVAAIARLLDVNRIALYTHVPELQWIFSRPVPFYR
jgi:hypothetical protein